MPRQEPFCFSDMDVFELDSAIDEDICLCNSFVESIQNGTLKFALFRLPASSSGMECVLNRDRMARLNVYLNASRSKVLKVNTK